MNIVGERMKLIKPDKSVDLIGHYWHIRSALPLGPPKLKDRTTVDLIGCSFDEVEKLFNLTKHGMEFCMILMYITDNEGTLLIEVEKNKDKLYFDSINNAFIHACKYEPSWKGRSCNPKFFQK